MRPSHPVRHLTSSRKPGECSTSTRRASAGLALARDHHGLDPELLELLVDAGLAVAAIGGAPPVRVLGRVGG